MVQNAGAPGEKIQGTGEADFKTVGVTGRQKEKSGRWGGMSRRVRKLSLTFRKDSGGLPRMFSTPSVPFGAADDGKRLAD